MSMVAGRFTLCIAGMLVVLCAGVCRAKEPAPEEVLALVRQLGDPSFKVRDAAQNKLLEFGVAIRPMLLEMPPAESPEARRRVDQILKTFYQRELSRVRIIGVGFYTTNFGRFMPRSEVFSAAKEMIAARDHKDPTPSKRIWDLLDPFMKKTLEDETTVKLLNEQPFVAGSAASAPARKLHTDLRRSLEKVFDSKELYDKDAFATIALPEEGRAMLQKRDKLSPLEIRWLNYTLASAAFPDLLRSTANKSANGIVTVRVPASTQPIILVLSAYESTLWKVEAHPKSNLLQIVVGGYYPQEVMNSKVPVVYKVYQSLPALQRTQDYFYAYTNASATYQRMVNCLQQLFGKSIDHFQGTHTYQGDPVVIDPNQ